MAWANAMASMVELVMPGSGAALVRLLVRRRGKATRLRLNDGAEVTAWNCAWGMDYGREWEHLTLNMSPRSPLAEAAFLSARDVVSAVDPVDGAALYERPGPSENENAGA